MGVFTSIVFRLSLIVAIEKQPFYAAAHFDLLLYKSLNVMYVTLSVAPSILVIKSDAHSAMLVTDVTIVSDA